MDEVPKAVVKALTDPWHWDNCNPKTKLAALDQMYDAARQVTAARDRATRSAMLSRLPPHIAEMVRARISALWGSSLVFVTDTSPDGRREAMREAEAIGGTVHVLSREGQTWVTKKAP